MNPPFPLPVKQNGEFLIDAKDRIIANLCSEDRAAFVVAAINAHHKPEPSETETKVVEPQGTADVDAENAQMREALERIDNWATAYPLEVFPEPDLEKAAKVLKAAGMTLDAISADNMRHVLDRIKDIVKKALARKDK